MNNLCLMTVYGARPFLWYGPQECLEADEAKIVMANADPEPKCKIIRRIKNRI